MNSKIVMYAYDSGYRVSEDGEKVTSPTGDVRKLGVNEDGYLFFGVRNRTLGINGPCRVHHLAALQWFDHDEVTKDGIHIRHLDGNSRNNARENLALGTPQQNSMDRPEEERKKHAKVAASYLKKLSDDQVRELRRARKAGASYKELQARFGLTKSTVSYIVNRKTYTDVPDNE